MRGSCAADGASVFAAFFSGMVVIGLVWTIKISSFAIAHSISCGK